MRMIAILVSVFLLLLTSSALGVDKTTSTRTKQKSAQSIPAIDSGSSGASEKSSPEKTAEVKKDYNDFIDTNNNGLDDRAENVKSKQVPPPSNVEPEKRTKAPAPDSTKVK